jgi:hypothetical protein
MSRRRALLLQAAVGAFDPLSISGCRLWLDAADGTTFSYSSGTVVSEWRDKSGNSHHVSHGNSFEQPSRNTTINGLDAVAFDGSNDRLTRTATALVNGTTGEFSAFAVVRFGSVAAGVGAIIDNDVVSGSRLPQILRRNGTALESIQFRSSTPYTDAAGVTLATSTAYQVTTVGATTQIETRVDRSSNGATSSASGNLNTGSTVFRVGANAGTTAGSFLNGTIAEILVYNTALSNTNRDAVESYLKGKWGTA